MTRVSLVRALGLRGYQWTPQPNDHPEYPFATAVREGDVIYTSGQIPIEGDTFLTGLVSMRNLKEAQRAAELCAVQCLYAAGSLVAPEDILGVIKLTVFVNNDPLFDRVPLVANGASTFLNGLFGTRHARTAVGARLPSGALVEIEAIIRVR
jgi:enamine deaminase RidA (YjgF/YER057c/UK114 family)